MLPKDIKALEERLFQCVGTSNYYELELGVLITDGIVVLADGANAWWLVNFIAAEQSPELLQRHKGLQMWHVEHNGEDRLSINCLTAYGEVLFKADLPRHNFPFGEKSPYLIYAMVTPQDRVVICLPSER